MSDGLNSSETPTCPVHPDAEVYTEMLIDSFDHGQTRTSVTHTRCSVCRRLLKSGKPRNIPGLLFVGSSPNIPEPQPSATSETPIIDLVLADLKERSEAGKEKYGTYLQATNGRDALIDAYQEAMDLVMYLRQEIEQRRQRT